MTTTNEGDLGMSFIARAAVTPQHDSQGAAARIYTSLDPEDDAKLTVAEVSIEQGKATGVHYHKETEEVYVVLSGVGRMRLDDEIREVRAGDCVVITPGVVHQISNSQEELLTFVATCAPRVDPTDFYAADGTAEPLALEQRSADSQTK